MQKSNVISVRQEAKGISFSKIVITLHVFSIGTSGYGMSLIHLKFKLI